MKKSFVINAALVAVLAAGLAGLSACGSAETWDSLSKRMIASCTKFQAGIEDLSWTMEMEVPSSEGALKTTTLLQSKGKKFRAEVSMEGMENAGMPAGMNGMKTIIISDGESAWIVNPMMGKSKIPVEESAKYRGQWNCEDYMPVAAEIIGSEKIGDYNCYVLAVLDASSEYAKLWIDQKGFRLMKMEGKPQEGVVSIVLLSDYRKVSGEFEMPFRTEIYSGKDLISTAVVTSAEVNKGLSDEIFDAGAIEASGPDMKSMMDQVQQMKQKLEEGEE